VQLHFGSMRLRTNFQIQVPSSLFFRNKAPWWASSSTASTTRRSRRPSAQQPQAALHRRDAVRRGRLQMLFSFARAYFTVEMIPAAYVQFLRSLMPRKPRSEITTRWPGQSRARTISTATSSTTRAIRATTSASRPASRAW
jgi:isocitrate dehydrogenase kinase/phosphatase